MCSILWSAFDSVPHAPLLNTLRSLSLDSHTTNWLHNYLADRYQAVVVNGSTSTTTPVLSGVPQGSVLGPLLFLIYIDDLSETVQALCSKINLFADDILLYHLITSTQDYVVLQEATSLIDHWLNANHLTFNQSKRKYKVNIWPSLENVLQPFR